MDGAAEPEIDQSYRRVWLRRCEERGSISGLLLRVGVDGVGRRVGGNAARDRVSSCS